MDLLQTVRKEGSRGGRAEFKWEDVKNDAQRENYLGHSLMAPVGRWQQGRDLNWYAKGDEDSKAAEAARIADEKRKLKEAEEDAMLAAMGLPVPVRDNANLTPLGQKAHEADVKDNMEKKAKEEDDEDKSRRKERKDRSSRRRDDDGERRRRHRSRSRSRDRERRHRHRDRSRSRDRRRDENKEGRRHRSRSREHKRRDREDRPERRRERDDGGKRSRSRSRERRRHRDTRSRSPYMHPDRRRD